jgi:4-hydroxy-2-oxoheptanedioate aldolase
MSSLKSVLASGRVANIFCIGQLPSPKVVEMVAHVGGFDAVWLDHEHCGLTVEQLENLTRAGRAAGIDTFVRLAATDYAAVMRPLEAGAGGVMASQVRSAREAADVVRWSKFHPLGQRGIYACGVDGRYGTLPLLDYLAQANANTFVAIQIENAEAVADADAIAAVPGVDLLFVGPADLSQSLGVPGQWDHPRLWQAIERVAETARRHNVAWGILPANPAVARRSVDLGCRLLSIGLDVWAYVRGLKAFQREYADCFPAAPARNEP